MASITGRTSASFVTELRASLRKGAVTAGEFLPSERELAEKHNLGRKTVRLALKTLEAEGVIATVPRHGYRVLPPEKQRGVAAPVAYVAGFPEDVASITGRNQVQLNEFHRAAGRRGWPLLAASVRGLTPYQVLAQLRQANPIGAVLDTDDAELIRAVATSGLPAVLVDAWRENVGIDSVMQDGHQGGLLAVAHLVARGHRRIAWFGPRIDDAHSKDRFGGFAAGMAAAGLHVERELYMVADETRAQSLARELLAGKDRPRAVVALWAGLAIPVARAAEELGLVLGRDLDLVGWSMDEVFESTYRPSFPPGRVPPTVTWSVRTMAEAALARMTERRQNPALAALRVRIPVKLQTEKC